MPHILIIVVGEIIHACIRTAEQFNIGWRRLRRMRFKVQLKSSIVDRCKVQYAKWIFRVITSFIITFPQLFYTLNGGRTYYIVYFKYIDFGVNWHHNLITHTAQNTSFSTYFLARKFSVNREFLQVFWQTIQTSTESVRLP